MLILNLMVNEDFTDKGTKRTKVKADIPIHFKRYKVHLYTNEKRNCIFVQFRFILLAISLLRRTTGFGSTNTTSYNLLL